MRQLLRCRSRGIRIENGIHAYEDLTGKLAIESLSPSDLLFSDRLSMPIGKVAFGRVISVAIALVGLAFAWPLMIVIAILVKLTSPGPVFFAQDRIGLRGRSFRLFKFRTMRVTPATISEWEVDNVARITAVGHWLRWFRLDEVPQFWNILRGDMNLIGPRPHPVSNHRLFLSEIPYYELRSSIRPGLTGWAQIHNGYANDLAGEIEKMRYDLFYIANPSLWLDVHILLTTLRVVVFRAELEGAPDAVATPASAPRAS
jgi:lipopolysaccharide/colanic/teichoic acid biosynthesis glycosyltransferase